MDDEIAHIRRGKTLSPDSDDGRRIPAMKRHQGMEISIERHHDLPCGSRMFENRGVRRRSVCDLRYVNRVDAAIAEQRRGSQWQTLVQ
jgi:hypothetical protein